MNGFPSGDTRHFKHQTDRRPRLEIGEHSAITKDHHLDCTSEIVIGSFTTIAGYGSQLLTHSIDIEANRQDSKPIHIGNYCFVGTDCTILGGAKLPDYSVLGAKSLLNKGFEETYKLYAGVPAREVKELSKDSGYLKREEGFVW